MHGNRRNESGYVNHVLNLVYANRRGYSLLCGLHLPLR